MTIVSFLNWNYWRSVPNTAPANGWFFVDKLMTGANQIIALAYDETVNDHYIFQSMHRGVGTNYAQAVSLPVKKNQKIVCNYGGNGTCRLFRFYYAEGGYND